MSRLHYVRIWEDEAGESHFEDAEIELATAAYAPPAPPFDLAEAMAAERAVFFSIPPGWFGDWHPAPRRQLYFNLGGQLEVVVSDGETRVFGPGDIALTEDIHGRGHTTRVVGDAPSIGAFVHLRD